MGSLSFFDKMLPIPPHESRTAVSDPRRQLEIVRIDRKLWLRLGPLGKENSGEGWTVLLSEKDSEELVDGLTRARIHLGHEK